MTFGVLDIQLSANSRAYQLGTLTDVAFAKCLAWLPVPELEGVIALGHLNGRIHLASILGANDSSSIIGKEYASKHNRQCNTLAWGTTDPYMLAAGFDKHRSEHGLLLWDMSKTGSDSMRPVMEAAFGDTVASLAWFNFIGIPTLVAGVNSKQLRLYDIRGNNQI